VNGRLSARPGPFTRLLYSSRVPVVSSVPQAEKRVAFTFDDGPHATFTRPILEALAAHGARATFFVRGAALDETTVQIVRETLAAGHEVGNHTYRHLNFDYVDDATITRQITLTHDQLAMICGRPPVLIRPPYASALKRVDAIATAMGYRATCHWSISASDYRLPLAHQIVEGILGELHDGAIVLLHDGCAPEQRGHSRGETVKAVRRLIPTLLARGYELVTLSELLDARILTRDRRDARQPRASPTDSRPHSAHVNVSAGGPISLPSP